MELFPIAYIHSDYGEKFGIPRQSGLVPEARARVVFEPEFCREEALRGIEGFSHLWLVWLFSANRGRWSPTVRPPRLGGNKRLGVFATRSPFRPNPIGLSCVKLLSVERMEEGPQLLVGGADLMDGTPILDIKPYLPYADCVPEAVGGFAEAPEGARLHVVLPDELVHHFSEAQRQSLIGMLSQDPRPSYQREEDGREYGVLFAGKNVRFRVDHCVLKVIAIEERNGRML